MPAAECGLVQLDGALDKLAGASGPIKQRLLMAAAHVVSADGVLLTEEAELLRAIAASLDVPVPPLSAIDLSLRAFLQTKRDLLLGFASVTAMTLDGRVIPSQTEPTIPA